MEKIKVCVDVVVLGKPEDKKESKCDHQKDASGKGKVAKQEEEGNHEERRARPENYAGFQQRELRSQFGGKAAETGVEGVWVERGRLCLTSLPLTPPQK